MNEIGLTIRTARKEKAWTQAELSTSLGMSRATLSALENGKVSELGIRKVMALCSALGLELVIQGKASKVPTPQTPASETERRKCGGV